MKVNRINAIDYSNINKATTKHYATVPSFKQTPASAYITQQAIADQFVQAVKTNNQKATGFAKFIDKLFSRENTEKAKILDKAIEKYLTYTTEDNVLYKI